MNIFESRAIQLTRNTGAGGSDALKGSGDEQKGEVFSKCENCNKNENELH